MKNNGKIKQEQVLTAIVGSYPKFRYIYPKSGRSILDTVGFSFDKFAKEIGRVEFNKRLDKAVLQAIEDQNKAGLDIITDGEERRSQYVMHILKGLDGISFKKLNRVAYRGGLFHRNVPTIIGAIKYKKPILLKDFLFTRKYAKGFTKIGLPGPSTAIDSLADRYYGGDLEKIAYDYADAINKEIGVLIKAGCQLIQFDDPVLLRFPDRAKKWGIQALQRCFEGFSNQATFIVHICCGYPNKPLEKKGVKYKANHEYYKEILTWLAKSKLDIVSIEGEQSKLDLSVLPAIGEKIVMLGVLDVGSNKVETVEHIFRRGKEALKYIKREQLILAPDCGLLEVSRVAAIDKLSNMVLAARRLNKESI